MNVKMSDFKRFEILFNVNNNNNFENLKNTFDSNQIFFFKEYIEKQFLKMDQLLDEKNTIFVSELYFIIFGMRLIKNKITDAQKEKILSFLDLIKISEGGFKPSNNVPNFKENFQRIYSTYYGLIILNEINELEKFKEDQLWVENTKNYISSQQREDGFFSDSIALFSTKIQNSYWAILILYFLNSSEKQISDTSLKKLTASLIQRLENNKIKSVTELFYLVLCMKSIDVELSEQHKKIIINFIESVKKDNFFYEFPFDIKKTYRIDFTESESESLIHSNIYAKIILRELNEKNVEINFKRKLLKKYFNQKKFENQLKIKNMNYGPPLTTFEIVLFLLFCLDAE